MTSRFLSLSKHCRLHFLIFLKTHTLAHTHAFTHTYTFLYVQIFKMFLQPFGLIFWLYLILSSNCQTASIGFIIRSILLHFFYSIQCNYSFNKDVLFFLFILGTKTVMRFIVKLCVGDFLLLLDVREFDIEAANLVTYFT